MHHADGTAHRTRGGDPPGPRRHGAESASAGALAVHGRRDGRGRRRPPGQRRTPRARPTDRPPTLQPAQPARPRPDPQTSSTAPPDKIAPGDV